jgi:RNA polymerase sigma factor (sigma-70 family)
MPRISKTRAQYISPKLHPFMGSRRSFLRPYFSPSISQTKIEENPRSREEEIALFKQIKFGGISAEKAKEAICQQYRRHVRTIAMKYRDRGLEFNDLTQEGYVGLMRAVEKFEPGRGFRFSTLAPFWIRAEIGNAITMKAHNVRLSKNKAESQRYLNNLAENYRARTGEYPTAEQLSGMTGLPSEKVEVLLSTKVRNVSLYQSVNTKDGPTWEELLAEEANLDLESAAIVILTLRRLLNALPPNYKRAMELLHRLAPDHPGQKMNYREAGEIIGISRQRVERKSASALKILKKRSSNSHRLSPYKKWSDDEKALKLMEASLPPRERKLFELTYKNWVTKSQVAKVFKVPEHEVTELRNELDEKLDDMYEIIQRQRSIPNAMDC